MNEYVTMLPLNMDRRHSDHICIRYFSLTRHRSPKFFQSCSVHIGSMEMSLTRISSLAVMLHTLQAILIALHVSLRYIYIPTSSKKPCSPNVRLSGLKRSLMKRSCDFSIRKMVDLLYTEKTFLNSVMYRYGLRCDIESSRKLSDLIGSLTATELYCIQKVNSPNTKPETTKKLKSPFLTHIGSLI